MTGGLAPGDRVTYRDHRTGSTVDAVVTALGETQRGAGQSVYIRTEDGRTVYTNERTLTRREGTS